DGDGDKTAWNTGTVQVDIRDDVPTASYSGTSTITEDGVNGVFAPQTATGTLVFNGGADGATVTDLSFRTSIDMDHSNSYPPLSSHGVALTYATTVANGVITLTASAGGTVVFTLSANQSTGAYEFKQFGSIDHPANSDDLRLVFDFAATDGDGDKTAWNTGTVQVDIRDDVPTASFSGRITVQETANANGSFHETSATGTMNFDGGADGAKVTSIAYGLGSAAHPLIADADAAQYSAHALQSGGKDIHIEQPDGLTLVGKLADGTVIFTVEVTDAATGAYKFTQLGPIDQPDANETGAADGGRMKIVFTVIDGDGDTATNSLQIDINDDGPSINGDSHPANLLANGDFSGGTWSAAPWDGALATESTGWKIEGTVPGQQGVQLERVNDNYMGMHATGGSPMVDLGASPGNIQISQNITGLAPGDSYKLTFEAGSPDAGSSKLEVYWNGQLVGTIQPTGVMQQTTLNLIAAGGTNTLTFKEVGNGNDNTGTYLANVNLTHGADIPVFHATTGEDSGVISFHLAQSTDFSFGADNNGTVTFDTAHVTIATPKGTIITLPPEAYNYNAQTGVFTINPGHGFDSLSEGEVATLTVPFKVTDGDGDSRSAVYQITITGANDAAAIGTPTVSAVTEDVGANGSGFLTATGTISVSDADHDQSSFQTTVTSAAGNLGSLVLAADGSYTYSVSNAAVQYLQADEQRTETFTIKSADGTTKDISFTINGANDAAVIGTPTVSGVTEDVGVSNGLLKATGTISVSDADHDQSSFQTAVTGAAGNLGSLVLAADGSYTYSVSNAAVQFLQANEQKTETFTIKSAEGTTKDISFTITGANDAAVIGTPTVSGMTEDVGVSSGLLKATGTISVSDADHDQSSFQTTVTSAAGNLGSLVLAADGSYTYSVSNAAV
ncbi:hypothetical protein HGP14_34990, partial [Rhizobium sp. P32RR-XVIII]|uniref:VCBS domain-containing protein n=1 Tax=Rhizobium sp. P32RR-XVIII TaxID=2726738 RepID=UPI0018472F4A